MELIALEDDSRYSLSVPFSNINFFDYGNTYVMFVTSNNEIYELDLDNKNNTIKLENLPFKIVKYLVCVSDYSVIVNEKNEIFIKGYFLSRDYKKFTLLENISLQENITKIRVGENYFLILTKLNSLFGYGENGFGQLGIEEETNKKEELIKINHNLQISDIQASNTHSMILDIFGSVYSTGQNNYGQLGLGDTENRYKFTKVELPFKVIKIYADNLTSLIVNENNELYVTGYNKDGELGSGMLENIKTFTKIIINNFNTKRYNFNFSHSLSSFIIDGDNNIFVSGGSSTAVEKYGITIKNHLTEFTKINIPLNKRKFSYVIPLSSTTIIVLSDYEINYENEKESMLGLKVFQKVLQKQLVDINFVCKDYKCFL